MGSLLEDMAAKVVSSVWIGVFLILGLWLFNTYRSHRRLQHFRGPWVASFSKLWMVQSTFHGRMYLDVAEACKQYGNSIYSCYIPSIGFSYVAQTKDG